MFSVDSIHSCDCLKIIDNWMIERKGRKGQEAAGCPWKFTEENYDFWVTQTGADCLAQRKQQRKWEVFIVPSVYLMDIWMPLLPDKDSVWCPFIWCWIGEEMCSSLTVTNILCPYSILGASKRIWASLNHFKCFLPLFSFLLKMTLATQHT